MASGNKRHGKGPAAAVEEQAPVEEDKFPEGLRVLAVDDDPVCLRVLEALLRICKYNPTMVTDARTALEMLREGGEDHFDLVITDVHMPDMDGFKLLELIGLEMDLPVIMLSVNGDKEMVRKGIEHGACDYLVKPVNIKELRNIWQHVIRKNQCAVNHNSSDSDNADQRVAQPVIAERGEGGPKSKKCSKKKRNGGNDSDESNESTRTQTTRKRPRVSWSGALHMRFLDVVSRLGVDQAVPKTILQMMNVDNLSRESVASHLQKYRLYLKRVTDEPNGDSLEKRPSSCYMDMNHSGSLYPHHQQPSSAVAFDGSVYLSDAPSILGPHGLSIQPRNLSMGTVGNGGGNMPNHAAAWLPDTTRRHASGPPISSFADHTMQDAFPPSHSSNAFASVLREKLLEASSVVPTSHPGNSSFAEMPNAGLLNPANQFPVQPPELIGQFSGPMYVAPCAVSTHVDAHQFPYLAGSSSNPWQNVAPLPQPQVNITLINQLQGFGASAGQMAMFQNEQQNQMAGIINNNTTIVGVFSEPMTPLFNMASNTAPVEMAHDNFSPVTQMMVNGGSTSSPLPNLQMGSSVAPPTQMVNDGGISSPLPELQDSYVVPTQVLNVGDASGVLPVQEGPAGDQQAPGHDQTTYSNDDFLEQIFASMVSQDFNPDDAFFGEEY